MPRSAAAESAAEHRGDDFERLYAQYRPRPSPAPSSYYSAHSSQSGGSSQDPWHTFNRNGAVYRSYPSYMPRSRSHGRDFLASDARSGAWRAGRPRTADTDYPPQEAGAVEDNISRDSGHSSAGTPEFAKRSFLREGGGREDWGYRSRGPGPRRQHQDTFSLCGDQAGYGARGHHWDRVSLHSVDTAAGYTEQMKPAVMPRKSLMNKQRPAPVPTPDTAPGQQTRARHAAVALVSLSVVAAAASLAWAAHLRRACDRQHGLAWDTAALHTDLFSRVVGQNLSIEKLEGEMEKFSAHKESSRLPILVLIVLGSSGTGKTFISEIIEQNFPVKENIHRVVTSQTLADLPLVLTSSCGYSLVIIDDLEQEDSMMIGRLEKTIIQLSQMENKHSKGVLVIITSRIGADIINLDVLERTKDNISLREKLSIDTINDKLDKSGLIIPLKSNLEDYNVHVTTIPLLPLTRENVRDCTVKMFLARKIVVKQFEVTSIVDQLSFFSPQHPVYAKHGCKQLAARVNTRLARKQEL